MSSRKRRGDEILRLDQREATDKSPGLSSRRYLGEGQLRLPSKNVLSATKRFLGLIYG